MELVWTVSTRTAASLFSHRHRPGEPWGALSCLSFVLRVFLLRTRHTVGHDIPIRWKAQSP